ncbi:MAG: hypothetical protein R3E10_18030 [Gemmatimonadota bacterium]
MMIRRSVRARGAIQSPIHSAGRRLLLVAAMAAAGSTPDLSAQAASPLAHLFARAAAQPPPLLVRPAATGVDPTDPAPRAGAVLGAAASCALMGGIGLSAVGMAVGLLTNSYALFLGGLTYGPPIGATLGAGLCAFAAVGDGSDADARRPARVP